MKMTAKALVSFAICIAALMARANDTDYGPFGSSDDWTWEAGNKDRTATPVIGLSSGVFVGANKAAEGDCIAAYRKDKNVICGLGRVDSTGKTGIKFEVNSGVEVHFKLWVASSGMENPKIFDIDSTCDFTVPATDLPTVDLGELTITKEKVFGPGEVSNFEVSGVGEGTLVGASEVSWRDFSSTDYYGTKTFVNANIVDAEKTAADDNDDYWCYPMSDMDALYLTGWSKNTSCATVDDMAAYFRKNPRLLRYMQSGELNEGTYGFVGNGDWGDFFDWYKDVASVDLIKTKALTEGAIGASFLSELRDLFDNGRHVVRVNVYFDNVTQNKKWKGFAVSHGVLCVGYVADGDTLKALFIIDPDNNQYTGTGGAGAPNSIMYCPVEWNNSTQSYTISGVWGQDGVLLPEYRALSVMPNVYTVTFKSNGGTGTMAAQKFPEGVEQALDANTFKKSGYMFVGWKDHNGNEYEDGEEIVATGDLTLTAQWEAIVVECNPKNAAYAWRSNGDDLLVGEFDVTCNTAWTAMVDKPWVVLFAEAGDGDGTVEYSLSPNSEAKAQTATITVASTVDSSVKAVFTISQSARPPAPELIVDNGVLVSVDMHGYADCTIPDTVAAIGANAFADNEEVFSVRIPATVTEIGDSAFAGCANLTDVVFDGNAPATGEGIFEGTPDALAVTVRNDKTGWPKDGELWPAADDDARAVVVLKNYIVSFDWNGWEDGPAIEEIVVEPGEGCKLPERDLYTSDLDLCSANKEGCRLGYRFKGWNESGIEKDGSLDFWEDYVPLQSVTLKAIWSAHWYKFNFNANGGSPSTNGELQLFGERWGQIEEPTLANAVFDGWWTAKTGGERIDMGEVCTVVGKLGGTMTLYAHWRKMFKATVKDGMVSKDVENYAANITVLSGTDLCLEAADKSDKNMVFSKWTVSPATANLGEDFDPRNPSTPFTMPDAAVTFTANYIAKPGYVEVSAFEQNATANEDGDPQGIEWSDDGKVWTPVGTDEAYPVKTGKVTLQFRSTDPRWTVPAKVTYQIVEDETAEIEVGATRVTIVEVAAECEQFGASGTVSMNPKNGQVLPGKPVALTAKPGKDTVFAYWLVDGEKVGCTTTFKYAPDVDSTVTAVFRLKSAVEDPVLVSDDVVPSANSMVGVAFEMAVPLADAAYPAKFSAKGLPAGLKIDAASGVISGAPTKVGNFLVTLTAAGGVNTKAKSSITLPITVKALPEWAQGAFTGRATSYVEEDDEDFLADAGLATFTVSTAGKISGKVSLCGTNWTFAAASYDVSSTTGAADENLDGAEEFVIATEMKAGKVVKPLRLTVIRAGTPQDDGEALQNASVWGWTNSETEFFDLYRTMWKDKSTAVAAKAVLAAWEGVYTLSIAAAEDYGAGYLSLTVGKDGNVKATGKLADGTGVSAASPLMYDEENGGFFAYLYAAPSAYKGGAFALGVGFEGSPETQRTLSDVSMSQWTSRNIEATGERGEGFDRILEFSGAYYDKLNKLSAYYEQMRLSLDDMPTLAYTYKSTYFDDDTGRKVSESWLDEAEAVDTLSQDGLTVSVDEKGKLVVTKATKPVKDQEGEWLYEGENDGALTLSFTQATGIFKGSYTFWYDYESAYDDTTGKTTMSHTSKKVSFEGIMVQGADSMDGFYLWNATGVYEDEKTGKEKTYKYKESYPVSLERLEQ